MKTVATAFLMFAFLILALAVIVGLALGINCLFSWLICAVASGFGYSLPFWPVVGSLFLFQIFIALLKN